jgi:hypothetical protein
MPAKKIIHPPLDAPDISRERSRDNWETARRMVADVIQNKDHLSAGIAVMVMEEMKPEFAHFAGAKKLVYTGGLHWSRHKMIARVHFVLSAEKQVYLHQNLNQCSHYSIQFNQYFHRMIFDCLEYGIEYQIHSCRNSYFSSHLSVINSGTDEFAAIEGLFDQLQMAKLSEELRDSGGGHSRNNHIAVSRGFSNQNMVKDPARGAACC